MNDISGRGWRQPAIWYAYLTTGLETFFFSIQGNIVPFLKDEMGLSYRLVSFHSSGLAIGVLLAGALGERALRPLGRRLTSGIGAAGMVAGAILICLASSAWVSIPGFVLVGAFGALIPIVGVAVLEDAPRDWRPVAYAECNVMAYVFALAAPLLMGLCVARGIGWRGPLVAGMAASGAILWLFRATPLPASRPSGSGRRKVALPAAYWAYWALLSLGVAMEYAVLLWAPAFLEKIVGLPRDTAAALSATFFAAMMIGRYAGSHLVRFLPARIIYYAILLIILVGFLAYWAWPSPAAAVAGLFLLGLGIAQFYPLTASLAVAAGGADADKAGARLMSAAGLALLAAPAAMGILADVIGLRFAQLVLPVLGLAALGAFLLARRLESQARIGAVTSPI